MTATPLPDTHRPAAAAHPVTTRYGTILIVDRTGRSADQVHDAFTEAIRDAADLLNGNSPGTAPHTSDHVIADWWQYGYDSALGRSSAHWSLHLCAPQQPIPLPDIT